MSFQNSSRKFSSKLIKTEHNRNTRQDRLDKFDFPMVRVNRRKRVLNWTGVKRWKIRYHSRLKTNVKSIPNGHMHS